MTATATNTTAVKIFFCLVFIISPDTLSKQVALFKATWNATA